VAPPDIASFAAGKDAGTRIASFIARLGAGELMDGTHWWNRRRRGALATALRAYADDLERDADAELAVEEVSP
jgi:hypothetical protein